MTGFGYSHQTPQKLLSKFVQECPRYRVSNDLTGPKGPFVLFKDHHSELGLLETKLCWDLPTHSRSDIMSTDVHFSEAVPRKSFYI